ncbi:MAG: pseudouridine synthase, partial [Clostridiales Family XIII bacterium]|nr:pseudouridine synthase [Clostridiales Family XIII bacterium]
MRINRYIASCGYCSRRKADELILAGKVKVNGKIINTLGVDILETDIVKIDGNPLTVLKKNIYLMLNKPAG